MTETFAALGRFCEQNPDRKMASCSISEEQVGNNEFDQYPLPRSSRVKKPVVKPDWVDLLHAAFRICMVRN